MKEGLHLNQKEVHDSKQCLYFQSSHLESVTSNTKNDLGVH